MDNIWTVELEPEAVTIIWSGGTHAGLIAEGGRRSGKTLSLSGVGCLIDEVSFDGAAVALTQTEAEAWVIYQDEARQQFDERYLDQSAVVIDALADYGNLYVAFICD